MAVFSTGFLFIGTFKTTAQAPAKEWDAVYGGNNVDDLQSLQQTNDGGYIFGGSSSSGVSGDKTQASWGGFDYWMVKADSTGAMQWDVRFGGSGDDILWFLQQTSDGGYILGGSSDSPISGDKTQDTVGGFDYWVVKTDDAGNKQWDARFGGSGDDQLNALWQTSDGGYILGGESASGISGDKTQASQGGTDYWIVKINGSGVKQWDATFGGNDFDYLTSLQQTFDGGYILGGYSHSGASGDRTQASRGLVDYWVVKTDSGGVKQWDAAFGGSTDDYCQYLQQTSDSGYILGGWSNSPATGDKTQASQGQDDFWVVKTDAIGTKQWDARFGGSALDAMYSLQQSSDGGYILGGYSMSPISGDKAQVSQGFEDFWLVKTNGNGVKQWDATFGGSSSDVVYFLLQTTDGGYLAGGISDSPISGDKTQTPRGNNDYWVVKLPPPCVCNIFGTVLINAVPAVDAEVILLREKLQPGEWDSVQAVFSDSIGEFFFSEIDSGTYTIQVKPDTNLFPSALPTYLGDVPFWAAAQRTQLSCGESDTVGIQLLQLPAQTGNGRISGYLYFGSSKRADPIDNEDIVIAKVPPGSAAAYTTTDANGYYEVTGLDTGNYQVIVEIAGMTMVNNVDLTITGSDTVFQNVDFNVDTMAGTIMPVTQSVAVLNLGFKKFPLYIFPNPAYSFFMISVEHIEEKPQRVELWDSKGIRVVVMDNLELDNKNNIEIKLRDLSPGIYLLKTISERELYNARIIIQ